jgi:hypothetical protein
MEKRGIRGVFQFIPTLDGMTNGLILYLQLPPKSV